MVWPGDPQGRVEMYIPDWVPAFWLCEKYNEGITRVPFYWGLVDSETTLGPEWGPLLTQLASAIYTAEQNANKQIGKWRRASTHNEKLFQSLHFG